MTEKKRGRPARAQETAPETTAEKAQKEMLHLTRRVLLAGIGAAALAYDEARALVDRLVERGELAQEQARDLLREVQEKRRGRLQEARGKVQDRLAGALQAFGVPTRADLEALQQRLDRLTERVEALLRERG